MKDIPTFVLRSILILLCGFVLLCLGIIIADSYELSTNAIAPPDQGTNDTVMNSSAVSVSSDNSKKGVNESDIYNTTSGDSETSHSFSFPMPSLSINPSTTSETSQLKPNESIETTISIVEPIVSDITEMN